MNRTTELTDNRARPAQYDAAFREQAVSLLEEGTRSITALARELGISHKTLSKWRQRRELTSRQHPQHRRHVPDA
jgi:transposase-like protein